MRVLIAEDDCASQILLEAVLTKWGYNVTVAGDGDEAWERLRADNAPPIAVVDWMMPGLSGVELCARVRSQPRELTPYLLLLTTKSDKADVCAGLDAGADDYLTKPFDLSELSARLRVAKRAITLQNDLIESRRTIHYQLLHDLSSGALNRGVALAELGTRLTGARPLTIGLIAIDDHKRIQQRQGAHCAEALVRDLVQRVRAESSRAIIGRYSADQLLVVLEGTGIDEATGFAERVRQGLSARNSGSADEARITVSTGLATWDGTASMELLVCYADAALYTARQQCDCVESFSFGLEQSPSA